MASFDIIGMIFIWDLLRNFENGKYLFQGQSFNSKDMNFKDKGG
jgi:hypothetical protein